MGRINLTVDSSGFYSQLTGYIEWSEGDLDIEHNTSSVTAALVYNRPADGADRSGWGESNFYLEINGTRFPYTGSAYIESGGTLTILAGSTVTVPHNADGSKSIVISGGGYIGDYAGRVIALQGSSGSATVNLEALGRQSRISSIEGSVFGENNESITVNIARKGAFYHKLMYSFGSASGVAGTTNSTSSTITWIPPTSLGAEIPDKISDTCTFTLYTYSDSAMTQQVDNPVTAQITLSLASYCVPLISNLLAIETNPKNNTTPTLFYILVSKIKFRCSVLGRAGSPIDHVSVTFMDEIKQATISSATAETDAFEEVQTNGTYTCEATVVDQRGRSASTSISLTVMPYSYPQLTAKVRRSKTTPSNVITTLSAMVTPIVISGQQVNTMACYSLYVQRGGTLPDVDAQYQVSTSGISANNATKTYSLSEAYGYIFRVVVQDKFTETYLDFSVGAGSVILDINEDGKVGIGKYNEVGVLDVGGVGRYAIPAPSLGGLASQIITVPMYSRAAVGLPSATFGDDFLKAWVATVCAEFSGENISFYGATQCGSRQMVFLFVYDTLAVDQNTGLPQYSMGYAFPWAQGTSPIRFGTNNYTWWSESIGGGGASYQNADDISF